MKDGRGTRWRRGQNDVHGTGVAEIERQVIGEM